MVHTDSNGAKYIRQISNRLKEAVVQTAGRGDGLRSGAHVLKVLSKFNSKFKAVKDKVSNKGNYWTEPIMRRYLWTTQETMGASPQPVLSFTMDATRLSGKEYLFGSCYAPASAQAAWCTPIVPSRVLLLVVVGCKTGGFGGLQVCSHLWLPGTHVASISFGNRRIVRTCTYKVCS